MRRMMLLVATSLLSCVGSTGGERFSLSAAAAGLADGRGEPVTFTNSHRWTVRLDRATLHIGALTLNASRPISVNQETDCFLPGVYLGAVYQGLDVNLLDGRWQPFPALGEATSGRALAAEIWLTGGRIDAAMDRTPIVQLEGEAQRDGEVRPFAATVTIGSNRKRPPRDDFLPGSYPLCKERIVSPLPIDAPLHDGVELRVRIDPRPLLARVDFSSLPASGSPPRYRIEDDNSTAAGLELFAALRAQSGVYDVRVEAIHRENTQTP